MLLQRSSPMMPPTLRSSSTSTRAFLRWPSRVSLSTTPWRTLFWVESSSAARCTFCLPYSPFYRDCFLVLVTPLSGKDLSPSFRASQASWDPKRLRSIFPSLPPPRSLCNLLHDSDVHLGLCIGHLLKPQQRMSVVCVDALWHIRRWSDAANVPQWDCIFGEATLEPLRGAQRLARPCILNRTGRALRCGAQRVGSPQGYGADFLAGDDESIALRGAVQGMQELMETEHPTTSFCPNRLGA
jgi:hypothetical protein